MRCSNRAERKYDLGQISSKSEMWLDSENILNVEPAESPDGLDMVCEREGPE